MLFNEGQHEWSNPWFSESLCLSLLDKLKAIREDAEAAMNAQE
jgi:hypothetical protein